ncbi:protein S100-A10-like [Pteronotus mesoamericanus]|uniref:protein S100-A10-like n=1 Tax=Pteronotus mesoamericanus TaxID=1884717 RepID=UPI0023EC9769|nr:protein S100-A10-like [Pteronotus parnellii mesoamericanus]
MVMCSESREHTNAPMRAPPGNSILDVMAAKATWSFERRDLTKIPSQMKHAIDTMVFMFHRFAKDKGYLKKEDLRVLTEKEFHEFLKNQKDPLAMDKIMKDLDQCQDSRVGSQSFSSLIAELTITRYDYFAVHMEQERKQ